MRFPALRRFQYYHPYNNLPRSDQTMNSDFETIKNPTIKWLIIAAVGVVLFKLWMVGGHDLLAKFRPHDDSLFATLAISILEGNWLGDYGNKTLIKGVGYPVFVALSVWIGIPLLTLQHYVYIFACVIAIVAIRPLVRNPYYLFLGFLFLLFNPLNYSYPLMSSTMRASLYLSLSLLVFSTLIGIWNRRNKLDSRAWLWALMLGISFTWLWITREESIWIIPAMVVFLGFYLPPFKWNSGSSALVRSFMMVPLLIVFMFTHYAIVQINKSHYGVSVINELKSPEFVSALGGLMRIKPNLVETHVIVSRDAQARAFKASPTFAQLEPYLGGKAKMLASFYIWSLRSATRRAGYYDRPNDATREFEFYRKIGAELKAACESGELECFDRKASIRPVWHSQFNSQVLPVFWDLTTRALTFALYKPLSTGVGSKEDLETLFNYNILTGDDSLRKSVYFDSKLPGYYRKLVAKKEYMMVVAGKIYQYLTPVVFVLALGVHLYLLGGIALRREFSSKPIIGLLILGSIFTVLAMMTYIKISIWDVQRPMHTLSPILLLYVLYILLPFEDDPEV